MQRSLIVVSTILATLSFTTTADAHLGSFGPSEGYFLQSGKIYGDVTYYNAGQSGVLSGGGPYAQVAADSALWSLHSPVGSYFATMANRNAYASTFPAYPNTDPNGTVTYMVGAHFNGHNNDGYNLAFRNMTPVGTGPAIYEYKLDTYDTGGPIPASIIGGTLDVGFYFLPNPADAINPGTRPADKFTLSLKDSLGNIGMEWGYARDNEVAWRTSPSNPWNYTTVYADQANWDGVNIKVDLTSDTFGIDYYDVGTNTWSSMVATGTPLGQNLLNVTTLRWQLEDGVSGGLGGKNYFDDFSIKAVPEPSTVALIALGGVALLPAALRRRRRVRAG